MLELELALVLELVEAVSDSTGLDDEDDEDTFGLGARGCFFPVRRRTCTVSEALSSGI